MEVRFAPVGEAARLLGRDRSGLYRRVRAGTLLTDGQENVVLVDGQPVASVRELVARLGPGADEPVVDVRDAGAGEAERLLDRIAELEQELQLSKHERELERARSNADIAALAQAAQEAHAAAAAAHTMAASAARLMGDRASRG